jgi:hypothetical protein
MHAVALHPPKWVFAEIVSRRAILASNESLRGVVAFDDPLEEQVAAYPGFPRDTREVAASTHQYSV